MKALTFVLQGLPFAVPIEPVREIIGVTEVTPVPMTPPCLRGVMNLRGSVVPVIDLASRLGLGHAVTGDRSCILMIECAGDDGPLIVGALVDAVRDVLHVDPDQLAPPPSFGTRVPAAYLAGLLPQPGTSLMLLALDRVLSLAELEDAVDDLAAEPA